MSKYSDKKRAQFEKEMEEKYSGKGHPSMNDGDSVNGDERGAFSKPKPMNLDAAARRPRKIYVSEP